MNRTQVRWGVLALTVLTCLAMGNHTAYAAETPRVEAAGWYFSSALATNGNEIKIGVTGKCDAATTICPGKGRFEYFDTVTGLRFHGKINNLQFHQQTCANVPLPATTPAVTIQGSCDEGGSCNFIADLVDGGDPGRGNDWVCHLSVTGGQDKNHAPVGSESEDAQPLQKGNIKIRNFQP